MSASPVKYIFDLDMGNEPSNQSHKKASEIELDIKRARDEGYQSGLRDGEKSETARVLQAQLTAINNIATQSANMLTSGEQAQKQALSDAISLGLSVGRKLASHLIARYPDAELNALIKECLISLEDVPHLVIRCHPDLADISRQSAEENIKTSGFSGRLVVMGDPEIALGDGRIEWVKGGLVRNTQDINEQIDVSISNFLDAHELPKNTISTKETNDSELDNSANGQVLENEK